jgi:hypothetical protein
MLPLLKIAVNKMRTMSIVERSIEAKHALAKSKLLGASRPSPPLVSFSLRGPEMRELLAEDVDGSFVKQLAVDFAACRGPQALVGSMGLQGHNAVNEDFHLHGRLRRRTIAAAMYHCDLESKFAPHDMAKRRIAAKAKAKARELKKHRDDATKASSQHTNPLTEATWHAAQHYLGRSQVHKHAGVKFLSCRLVGNQRLGSLHERMKVCAVGTGTLSDKNLILPDDVSLADVAEGGAISFG